MGVNPVEFNLSNKHLYQLLTLKAEQATFGTQDRTAFVMLGICGLCYAPN